MSASVRRTSRTASVDAAHLREALALARRGLGRTSPNPMVGAVIVARGREVGRGYHRRAGAAHAENLALRRAGSAARGATLYVNLEPCAHHGRTPPCVEAILAAGIRRVVASIVDPDARVRGRGFAALRRAGVEVSVGMLEAEARALNEAYLKFARSGLPFVRMKAGMSLDGRIATRTGASRWITSERARREAHVLRWASDAVLVGVETILADDPRLTARRGTRHKEGLLRVILDSRLRTPEEARVVRSAGEIPTRIYTTRDAPRARERRLAARGVEIVRVRARGGRVGLGPVLAHLGRGEVTSVLVEGGGEVHASFLAGGAVDRVTLFVAPVLLGGRDAVPLIGGAGAAVPSAAVRLVRHTVREMGPEIVIDGVPAPPARRSRRRRGRGV